MTEFIQSYDKQYKKIRRISLALTILNLSILILAGVYVIFSEVDSIWFLLLFIIPGFIISTVRNMAYVRNVNKISYRWMKDFDVESAQYIFRTLLADKKRKDYAYLLSAYLNLLVIMCQFDEFDEVYRENQKVIQKSMSHILPFFIQTFRGLQEDRTKYREWIFQHKFSKYYMAEGELRGRQAVLRSRDEQRMVQQLYEMGDYEGTINVIRGMHLSNRYEHIVFGTYRQMCLYHLDHSHEVIIPDTPEFLCVRRLKYLRDTGKEYYYERAKECADNFEEDYTVSKKRVNRSRHRLAVVMFILIFVSASYSRITYEEELKNLSIDDRLEYDYEEYCEEYYEEIPVIKYEVGNNIFDNSDGSMYAFLDENTGWELNVNSAAAGSRWYDLSFTSDGGKTWEMINLDPFAGSGGVVEGIAFYDESYGYIAISGASETHSRLFRTEDGGYTFTEILLPFEQCADVENIESYLYHYMPEIDGEKAEVIVKCMRDNIDPGLVFQSEDYGNTWTYTGMTQ